MKQFYLALSFIFFIAVTSTNLFAQGTEDFEDATAIPDGTDSFTHSGITFNSSDTNFDASTLIGTGADFSDRYFDNFGFASTGASYSISTGGTLFTMLSLEMYVSSIATGDNPTAEAGATVTFTGKSGGVDVFSFVQSSGFPIDFTDNGFFTLDFSAEPEGGTDVSGLNIDELEITLTGAFQYMAIDNFEFGNEILGSEPPFVQSITVVGSPSSIATSVDFLVDFNENANNVDISDFVLDAVGTVGTISAVSASSGTLITVTVSGISGEGTISIDLDASNDIEDDLGNSPVPAFTAGETHFVSRCFQETFESFIDGDQLFSSNGIDFTTGTLNFNVEFLAGAGAGGSDKLLSNDIDTGTGKVYTISTVGVQFFNVEAIDFYPSSDPTGANPTDDGIIIIRGKQGAATAYTFTKGTGFSTNHDVNNGFITIDFETELAGSSLINIDGIEIEIGGAFQYIAMDNFEHCEEVLASNPPIVQSIDLVGDPEANDPSVDFTVIFNENANNVSLDDFTLVTEGTATGTMASISGSANTYIIDVDGISGEGSIRIDLNAGTDIEDDAANSPPDPFTDGEVHIVSPCDVETFESSAVFDNTFTRGGIPFSTGSTTNFSVEELLGGAGGGSDRFLSNTTDQGTGKVYNITITNPSLIFMNSMELYLSSEVDGANPTDDGTITIRGKLAGVTLYTILKSSGFPTSHTVNQGFFSLDFATDGAADYSNIDVDEVEIEIGGSFTYIGLDNFKFCEDVVAPIAVCMPFATTLDVNGEAIVLPTDIDGGSTDNASRFHLGLETNEIVDSTTGSSPTDEFVGTGTGFYSYEEYAFTVPVSGDYTFSAEHNSAGSVLVLMFFDSEPIHNSGLFSDRPEFIDFTSFNPDGSVNVGSAAYSFLAGKTYYVNVFDGTPGTLADYTLSVDMPIIAEAPKLYTCEDIGDITETLYVFDLAGNIDSCDAIVTVDGTATEYVAGGWNNGLPNLGSLALVTDNLNTAGISIDACACQVDGILTIDDGDYLQVTNDITVNGTLNVAHQGSVVQIEDDAVTNNNGSISVQKQTPVLGPKGFMILGNPMTDETREGVYGGGRQVLNHITGNFIPNGAVGSGLENFVDDNNNNWAVHSGALVDGEGYLVKPQAPGFPPVGGSFLLDYTAGTLNSGDIDYNLLFNTSRLDSPNMLGNPYASAIDVDLFLGGNALLDAVYYWQHLTAPTQDFPGFNQLNFNIGDISAYNQGSGGIEAPNGGGIPTQFMASGQGFGVKALGAGTVTFTNAMRVTGPNTDYRNINTDDRQRIWLDLKNDTYSLSSNMLVAFTEGATDSFEGYYDALRFDSPISLFSILDSEEQLCIQGRTAFNEEQEVALGFSTMVEEMQNYTISIRQVEGDGISNAIVYLHDKLLNVYTNLSEENYVFTSNAEMYTERFVLKFKEPGILDVSSNSLETISVYPNPAVSEIYIANPQSVELTKAIIYDLLGREMMSIDLTTMGNNTNAIDISNLASANYMMVIEGSKGTITKQIIKE
ncbi:MAG: T9SS type A sorting domain-containing protein [Flavobacteriaceae bacterium]|nr:T9SS type A sorting domain-containing protein [Flavobacteriaceae bacterium]